MEEQWQIIEGWPYEVSNQGRVRRTVGGPRTYAGRLKEPQFNASGYHHVSLSRSRGRNGHEFKTFQIAHLVARAFIGPRPYGLQINHKDGDKPNNRVDNLEYVTAAQNQRHAVEHGLFADQAGEANPCSKLTDDKVRELRRRRKAGDKITVLAREFGISEGLASMVAKRQRWKHIE